jgi:hypothetical protein
MAEDTWWEGPTCVTRPINGRRIVGACHDNQWRWAVYINGPAWQDTHLQIIFQAGKTVQHARELAEMLGPIRADEDESDRARLLVSQLRTLTNSKLDTES